MTLQEALDVVISGTSWASVQPQNYDAGRRMKEAAALLERAKPFLTASMERCRLRNEWLAITNSNNPGARAAHERFTLAENAMLKTYRTLVEPAEGEKE